MNQFRKVLSDINFVLGNVSVFDTILDGVIVFLICYLALAIFRFHPMLAAVPASIYLAFLTVSRVKDMMNNKARLVEKSYPPLRERLRTAIDNLYVNNPVVEDLQREVVEQMKNVRISSFIDGRATSYKIFATIVLCFVILFIASNNFTIDAQELADKGKSLISAAYVIGGNQLGEELGEIMAATGGTQLNDIYGKESAANLGNEVIDVQIRPISYEINVRNVKDVEEQEFEDTILDETCADTGECSPQESFRNDYPKEQQELVKNYFLKISKKIKKREVLK